HLVLKPLQMHQLDVALDDLGPDRHGPINPRADLDVAAVRNVPAEIGRDFDGEADLARSHPPIEFRTAGDRRMLHEITRAGDIEDIVLADRRLVAVEYGKGQVIDVEVDSIAHDEQQD